MATYNFNDFMMQCVISSVSTMCTECFNIWLNQMGHDLSEFERACASVIHRAAHDLSDDEAHALLDTWDQMDPECAVTDREWLFYEWTDARVTTATAYT